MIYIDINKQTLIPKTCKYIGTTIKLINLVDKKEYSTTVTVESDYAYKADFSDLSLTTGQYKYTIDEYETGLAQYGDFISNNTKSYNKQVVFKQYNS